MKCSIYARKSTDESGKNKEDTSVVRQFANSRKFIKKKGWVVVEQHVYSDDGISGAEFENRPGFQRLIAALKPKAFDVVVCSEPSRLGRDMTFTAYFVRQIVGAGVRIFYYQTDEEEKADTPEARLIGTIKSFTDEMERLRNRQRVREAHRHKAERGYALHGASFGYSIVKHNGHSVFQIVPEEADVVRDIFTKYVEGYGLQRLAKYLEEKEIESPRKGWWPSSIRGILRREMYIGKFVWGRTRKEDQVGRAGILVQQDPTVTMDVEHLRIVPQELWEVVQRRIRQEQANYIRDRRGRLMAKPEAWRAGKHLLAGFAKCAVCNGGMVVKGSGGRSRNRPPDHRRRYYCCCSNHLRGPKGCTNVLKKRIETVDHAVLDYLANEILQPKRMSFIMAEIAQRLRDEARCHPQALKQKERQKAKLEREVENLIQATADGRPPQILLRAIRDRESEIAVLNRELVASQAAAVDDQELERDLALSEHVLKHIRDLLGGSVQQARQILKVFLPDRLIFTPQNGGYDIKGQCNLGGLVRFQNKDGSP